MPAQGSATSGDGGSQRGAEIEAGANEPALAGPTIGDQARQRRVVVDMHALRFIEQRRAQGQRRACRGRVVGENLQSELRLLIQSRDAPTRAGGDPAIVRAVEALARRTLGTEPFDDERTGVDAQMLPAIRARRMPSPQAFGQVCLCVAARASQLAPLRGRLRRGRDTPHARRHGRANASSKKLCISANARCATFAS